MALKVLHIIDSLGIGGAEVLLANSITSLSNYKNIIVTLSPKNDFEESGIKADYVLDFKNKSNFFSAVNQLKKIIKQEHVNLLHSHLFWSTTIARFACPSNIPMVTTIHCPVTGSVEYQKGIYKLFDKLSFYYKKTALIGVSKFVLNDYVKSLGLPASGNYFVLYNYVTDEFIKNFDIQSFKNRDTLKIVSIGTLKDAKNYKLLIDALKLRTSNLTIDIIGEGPLRNQLQEEIDHFHLPIRLLGKMTHLEKLLPKYDLFVLASTYEGFGISVAEAAASGLPLMLSSIPVFKEITDMNAVFFDPYSPKDFNKALEWIQNHPDEIKLMSLKAQEHILKISSKKSYLDGIINIYQQLTVEALPL